MQVSKLIPDDTDKLIEFLKTKNYINSSQTLTIENPEEYARYLTRESDVVFVVKTVDKYGKICGVALSLEYIQVGNSTYWGSILGPGCSEINMLTELRKLRNPLIVLIHNNNNRNNVVKHYQALGFVPTTDYEWFVLKN